MRSRAFILSACILCLALPAHASMRDRLKHTENELEQSKDRQDTLDKKQEVLADQLKSLQSQLVDAVSAIQENERDLLAAEKKLNETAVLIGQRESLIGKNRDRLESLVEVALRLSRMPPEAMVMMPEGAKKTLRVSKALAMLSEDIKAQTNELARQKQELEKLQSALEDQKQAMLEHKGKLEKKRAQLEGQLKKREKLQTALQKDRKNELERAEKLAKKATGLKELMKELEGGKSVEADYSGPSKSAYKGRPRSFLDARGDIRMPVTGNVVESFGAENKSGGTNRGITIETASNAQVIAPFDGEIIFSGTFMTYGRMVILRHRDEFHTLLAGFQRLDVQTGDFLLEGEPIGAMGSKQAQKRLYIELRKNNQPIDPGPWIKGL